MSAELDALTQAVTNATTVEDSAITLIQGLAAKITAIGDAPPPGALQALADSINAEATKLASAVTANTPAAPAPTGATEAAT